MNERYPSNEQNITERNKETKKQRNKEEGGKRKDNYAKCGADLTKHIVQRSYAKCGAELEEVQSVRRTEMMTMNSLISEELGDHPMTMNSAPCAVLYEERR